MRGDFHPYSPATIGPSFSDIQFVAVSSTLNPSCSILQSHWFETNPFSTTQEVSLLDMPFLISRSSYIRWMAFNNPMPPKSMTLVEAWTNKFINTFLGAFRLVRIWFSPASHRWSDCLVKSYSYCSVLATLGLITFILIIQTPSTTRT